MTFSAAKVMDIVIVVTATEVLVLWLSRRRTSQGVARRDFMPTLLSGLLLMLALRMHIDGVDWVPTAALLACAGTGAFHAMDLRRRWRPAGRQTHAINRPS